MKQLIAVLVSAVLILGAWVVSGGGDDNGLGIGSGSSGNVEFDIYCATEAAEFCDSLDIDDAIVEQPAKTLSTLVAATSAQRAGTIWIVSEPWPALLGEALDSSNESGERDDIRLGSKPLQLAADEDTIEDIDQACGETLTWTCVTDRVLAGDEVGIATTDTTAGLLGVIGVGAGLFENNDYAFNDFDPAFRSELSDIAESDGNEKADISPARTLQTKVGAYDLAIDLDISLRNDSNLATATPSPDLKALLVINHDEAIDTSAAYDAVGGQDAVNESLDITAWNGETSPTDGSMPRAGVIAALLEEWNQLRD